MSSSILKYSDIQLQHAAKILSQTLISFDILTQAVMETQVACGRSCPIRAVAKTLF